MSEPANPVTPASGAGEVDNLVGALVAPRADLRGDRAAPDLASRPLPARRARRRGDLGELLEGRGLAIFAPISSTMGRSLPDSVSDEQILGWTRVTSVVGAALFAPLTYLAVAGIFLGLVRMVGGVRSTFAAASAVTVHGFLPFAVAAMVGLVMATLRTEITMQEIESGALVPSHLGRCGRASAPWSARC